MAKKKPRILLPCKFHRDAVDAQTCFPSSYPSPKRAQPKRLVPKPPYACVCPCEKAEKKFAQQGGGEEKKPKREKKKIELKFIS